MQINSATDALERFSTEDAARKYNQALVGTRKDLREQKSIELALRDIPEGARVLDFPWWYRKTDGNSVKNELSDYLRGFILAHDTAGTRKQ